MSSKGIREDENDQEDEGNDDGKKIKTEDGSQQQSDSASSMKTKIQGPVTPAATVADDFDDQDMDIASREQQAEGKLDKGKAKMEEEDDEKEPIVVAPPCLFHCSDVQGQYRKWRV